MPSDTTFVFVCQQGELEQKAALLAASLRRQLGDDPELIAAVPVPAERWGVPAAETLSFLEGLGVRTVSIENRVDPDYGHANKISALGVEARNELVIFLDSDILCLNAPSPNELSGAFCAKPADLATWDQGGDAWEKVYALFDLAPPERRVSSTQTGCVMPPYFNAGVIAVRAASEFAACWEDSCVRIDRDPDIGNKRPWLDQIGLAVTVARLGLDYQALGNRYNFPAHLEALRGREPVFCHYHWPKVIRREPQLLAYVRELATRFPGLEAVLALPGGEWEQLRSAPAVTAAKPRYHRWRTLLGRNGVSANAADNANPCPDIIISGVPRSGTSLLCRLLHAQEDCVIVNEPRAISGPLTKMGNPDWISTYYRDLRRDILDGTGIENRVKDGQLVDDTRTDDVRDRYCPAVSRTDFLLGTKNTLAYMARIPLLRRAMPDVPIIACVRHPLDTLASWKGSFPHLETVDFSAFPVSFTDHPLLTAQQRSRLRDLDDVSAVPLRRALLWAYLVDNILDRRDSLLLVRYEDLVADTVGELKRILSSVPGYTPPPVEAEGLQQRSRRELLDEQDYHAVASVCASQAEALGYRI